jgi:hypothetical protein
MIRHRAAAYFAVLALAIQAFAPVLAQLQARSTVLVPLCSVDGVTHYVEVPLGADPLKQRTPGGHEHCSLCTVGVDRLAFLAPFGARLLAVPDAAGNRPPSLSANAPESPALTFARPRGPPAAA